MKVRIAVIGLAALALVAGLGLYGYWSGYWGPSDPFHPSLERGQVLPVAEYRFSGPYAHDNLTLFLVHGRSTLPENDYLTLQEALEQGKVVVHETGEVNQLSIENRSDEEVFIQAGDVVKGGQQDRTFPYDFIAPPHSGKLPIDSFCVEQGRWSKRGKESVEVFDSSSAMLSSNSLKLAARQRSQGEVWNNVAVLQRKTARNLGQASLKSESPSSYQLAVENTDVQNALAPYLAALERVPDDRDEVIGVVVAVNGQVVSAEVYGSSRLFAKLWPKLVRSAATEAFAELQKGKTAPPVSLDAVKTFLQGAEAGEPAGEAVTQRVYVHQQQTGRQVLFDTCDRARDNVVVHRSVLAR
jgi:hypothetical protein